LEVLKELLLNYINFIHSPPKEESPGSKEGDVLILFVESPDEMLENEEVHDSKILCPREWVARNLEILGHD
jgi:hypothetical protein